MQFTVWVICVSVLFGGPTPAQGAHHVAEVQAVQEDDTKGSAEHVIIFDAGSSATRLLAYTWTKDNGYTGSDPPPVVKPVALDVGFSAGCDGKTKHGKVKDGKVRPGLSAENGLERFQFLVNCAEAAEPFRSMDMSRISVSLMATAGLRVLTASARSKLLDGARAILMKSRFHFRHPSHVRILSGEEEGVFAWLAMNWEKGLLTASSPGTLSGTHGVLEMGGASAQMAFKPEDPNLLSGDYHVQLGASINEHIYVHSHLYFGRNEARERLIRTLGVVGLDRHMPVVDNPCEVEHTKTMTTTDEAGLEKTFVQRGTGNAVLCRSLLHELLVPQSSICLSEPRSGAVSKWEDAKDIRNHDGALYPEDLSEHPVPLQVESQSKLSPSCTAGSVYQPKLPERVVLVGTLVKYWKYFDLGTPAADTLPKLAEIADGVCKKSWEDVEKEQLAGDDDAYLRCFQANYMHELLRAMNLRGESLVIATKRHAWPLGSALLSANDIPTCHSSSEKVFWPGGKSSSLSGEQWMWSSTILAIVCLVLAAVLCSTLVRLSRLRRKHVPSLAVELVEQQA